MNRSIEHLLVQVTQGEFALYREQAASMTADEFARIHNAPMRPWGKNGFYVDYLWIAKTGKYDGWDKPFVSGS